MPDKTKYNPKIHHRRSIRLKEYDYSQPGAYFITICVKDRACLFGKITGGQIHLNRAGWMINKWWNKIPEKFPDIELGQFQVMPNHFHAIAIITPVGADHVGADPRVCPNDDARVCPNDDPVRADLCVCPNDDAPIWTDTRVCPYDTNEKLFNENDINPDHLIIERLMFGGTTNVHEGEHMENILGEHMENILGEHVENILGEHVENILGEHVENILGEHVGSPLHRVVQWFKTMTTNEYIRNVKQNGWPRFNGKLWQRNYYEHIIRNEKSFQRITNYIYNNPANWKEDNFFFE